MDSITEAPPPAQQGAAVPPGSSALPAHAPQVGGSKRGAAVLPSLTEAPAKRMAVGDPAAAVAQLRAQIQAATQHSAVMQADAHAAAAAAEQARYHASAPAHSTAMAPAAPVVAGGPLASVLPAGHGGQPSHTPFVSQAPPAYSDSMAMPDSLVGPPALHLHSSGRGASPAQAGVPVARGHSLASTGMSLPLPAHSSGPAAGGAMRALDQDTHDIAEALASLGSRTPNSSVLPAQNVPPMGHGSMPPPALSGGQPMHMPTATPRGATYGYADKRQLATSSGVPSATMHGATTAGAGGIVTTTTPAPLSSAQAASQGGGLPPSSGSGSIGALAAQVQQLAAAMAQTQTMLQAQTVSHSNNAGGTAQSVNSGGGSVPPAGIVVPQQGTSATSGGTSGAGGGAGQSAAMARAAAATAAEAVARALGVTGRSDIVRSAVEQALSVVSAMYGGADALTPEASSAPPVMRTSAGMDARGAVPHRAGGIVQLPASMPAVTGSSAFSPPPAMAKAPLPAAGTGNIAAHSVDAPAGDSTSVMVAPGEIGGPHGSGGGARRSPVLSPPGTTSAPSGMPPPPGSMGTLPTGQTAVGEVPPPAPSTDSAGPSTGPTAEQAAAGAPGAAATATSHPSGSSFSGNSSAKQGALRYYQMAAPAGHLPQQGTAATVNHNAMAAASVAAASRRLDHVAPLPVEGAGAVGGAPVMHLNSATLQQHVLATQATEESAALQHVSASVTGAGEEYAAAQRLSGAVAVGDSLSQPGGLRAPHRQRPVGGLPRSNAAASHSAGTVYHGRQVHSSTPTLPAMSPAATTATTVPSPAPAPAGSGAVNTPPAQGKAAAGDAAPLPPAGERSVPGTPELSRQERQLVALRESGLRLPSDVGPGAAAHGTVGQAAAATAADGTGPAPALDNMSMTSGHRSMFTGSLLGGQSGVGGGAKPSSRELSGSDTATSAVVS